MIELNRIYNENCLEGMKKIPDESVDCIVCDLPYGALNKGNEKAKWDNVIPTELLFREYWRVAKNTAPVILFCQGMFTAQLMMAERKNWRYNLVWMKDRPTGFLNAKRMPMRKHEDIAVFYRALPTFHPQMQQGLPSHPRGHKYGKSDGNACYGSYDIEKFSKEMTTEKYPTSVIYFPKEKQLEMHPTQKPVALLQYLIRSYSNEGDTVLDNCMGSGTTAIAAIREKRNFIGFELNKEYYEKACKRIQKEQAQLTLF